MRELAGERRRFGYRRLHVLLRQEGLVANRKRTQRTYREEGLSVKRRRGRKKGPHRRAIGPSDDGDGTRAPILVEAVPNAR
jgi:transposase InsO family protein